MIRGKQELTAVGLSDDGTAMFVMPTGPFMVDGITYRFTNKDVTRRSMIELLPDHECPKYCHWLKP